MEDNIDEFNERLRDLEDEFGIDNLGIKATREMVLDYFRSHKDINELSTDDYQEIALNCAYNEFVNQGMQEIFRRDGENDNNDDFNEENNGI